MLRHFKDLKKLPRPIWVLATATLVNRMGTMALPYLALFLTQGRGLSITTAGSIIAIYGAVSFVVGPASGYLCDKIGGAKLLECSLLFSGIVLICFPFLKSLIGITIMTILWSMTAEAYRPASLTLVGTIAPPHQRKSAFALVRLSANIGMGIGPAIGGLLAQISYPSIFIVDGLTTLLACVVLFWSSFRTHARNALHESHETHGVSHNLGPLFNPHFRFFLLAITPVVIVFFQHVCTMPIFLVRDLKFPESAYGFLFAINTALIIAFEVPITAKLAHWNYRKSMSIGSFLFAMGFGGMAFAKTLPGIALTVITWTVGEMILFPVMNAYVSDMAPAKLRGQYMGAYMACFSGGFILAPWFGTHILDRFGSNTLWLSVLALGMSSPIMLLAVKLPARHDSALAVLQLPKEH